MLAKSGPYAKTITALIVYLAGAIPVVIVMSTWQQMVSYLVPGILAVLGVYVVPNAPLPQAQEPSSDAIPATLASGEVRVAPGVHEALGREVIRSLNRTIPLS